MKWVWSVAFVLSLGLVSSTVGAQDTPPAQDPPVATPEPPATPAPPAGSTPPNATPTPPAAPGAPAENPFAEPSGDESPDDASDEADEGEGEDDPAGRTPVWGTPGATPPAPVNPDGVPDSATPNTATPDTATPDTAAPDTAAPAAPDPAATAEAGPPPVTAAPRVVPPPPPPSVGAGANAEEEDAFNLRWDIGGYYRARGVWTWNVPLASTNEEGLNEASDAHFLFQRLRLNPSLSYGPDPDKPLVRLKTQLDFLDNVVFGDNSRISGLPLFAEVPGFTSVLGDDVPSIFVRRAWLEFLTPIGQFRVGRMPNNLGGGILVNDGNKLGDWGDPLTGSTADRILFATRPLTIFNAIANGDASSTPLILALAFDQLVENPLGLAGDPEDPSTRDVPFGWLAQPDDDVQEWVTALVWNQPDINPSRDMDNFTIGGIFIHRWQTQTESYANIIDGYWKLTYALGAQLPSLYTSGEVVTILADQSLALPTTGGCDDETGQCNPTDAFILNWTARVGLVDRREKWRGHVEVGYSQGDGNIFGDGNFSIFAMNRNYRVGLLMYPVALAQASSFQGQALSAVWSNGGVWNSSYIYPQFRYEFLAGMEVHAAFLVAWADQLMTGALVNNRRSSEGTSCGLGADCFLGWEADLALRIRWGQNDIMRWDTEFGIMGVGPALSADADEAAGIRRAKGFSERILVTFQTRIGFQF